MSAKPKILRILNRFNLGGPVYNASLLTKYLEDDFETLLIGGNNLEEEESALFIPESLGIKPIIIPEMTRSVGGINDLKAYQKISNIIREFKPDIVHTHASKAGALGRMAAKRLGVKTIVHTFHGHVFENYFTPTINKMVISTEKYLARKSHAIIAISELQKKDLVSKYKITSEKKVHVIPLGFDLHKFTIDIKNRRNIFRKQYNLDEKTIAIGIIGRLSSIKNHEFFIKNFAEIHQKFPNTKAFIIGDGLLKNNLKTLANQLGLSIEGIEADVVFTSWVKDVSEIIHGLDVVCLTSLNEGTPVSLIEAQAAGLPVISSDVGGVRDVLIKDSESYFKLNDAFEFQSKLSDLISNSEKRKKLGLEGQAFVFSKYSYERLVKEVKMLYLELLNKPSY